MLLTPRIVRTQELTLQDVSPIFIGSQQSLGLGGPPPLIAAPARSATPAPPAPAAPAPAPLPARRAGRRRSRRDPSCRPAARRFRARRPLPAAPAQPVPAPPGPAPPCRRVATARRPAVRRPSRTCRSGAATGGQIVLSPPGPDFRVGAGPYTVPVSITGASQVSSVSLTITFNPVGAARARRSRKAASCAPAAWRRRSPSRSTPPAGRIDIAIVRTGDPTGVAGTGLLGAVLFDAVGGGPANLTVTGAATVRAARRCRCSSPRRLR